MQVNLLAVLREPKRLQALLEGIAAAASGQIHMVVTDTAHLGERIGQAKPDVLLLEHVPGQARSSRQLLQAARACAGTPVPELLLCTDTSESSLVEMARLGVRGCVAPDLECSILAKAVLRIAEGQVWFPREWLLRHFAESGRESRPDLVATGGKRVAASASQAGKLTGREREIVALIGSGLTNKEIARQLSISDKTVQTQLHRVYLKLHASGRHKVFAMVHALGADSAVPIQGRSEP